MPGATSHVCVQGHRWEGNGTACPVCGEPPLTDAGRATLSIASLADLAPQSDDSQATLPQRENTAPRPTEVAGYIIERELGRGGMGVVYLARHLKLNRLVALKMILAGAHAGPLDRERFRIEAQAAAQLAHPNIVQIYEVGESAGHPYLALEYVPGESLADQLTGVPWPSADAVRLMEPLARAIHHAHERGIIHRDLKPANILVGDREPVTGNREQKG